MSRLAAFFAVAVLSGCATTVVVAPAPPSEPVGTRVPEPPIVHPEPQVHDFVWTADQWAEVLVLVFADLYGGAHCVLR